MKLYKFNFNNYLQFQNKELRKKIYQKKLMEKQIEREAKRKLK